MYNYLEEMTEDIIDYIYDMKIDTNKPTNELYEYLYDQLWAEDDVTGNGVYGYFADENRAKEAVNDNTDILKDALYDFCISPEEIVKRLFDWSYWDTTIRCNLLGEAIEKAIEEIKEIKIAG